MWMGKYIWQQCDSWRGPFHALDYSTNIVQLIALILAQTHIQFLAGPTDFALHQNTHTSSTAHPVAYSVGTSNSFPTGKVARVCRTTHLLLQPRLRMSGATTPPILHTVLACRQTALLVTSKKNFIVQTGLSALPCFDGIFILNAFCKFCHAHQCFFFSNTFQDLFLLL